MNYIDKVQIPSSELIGLLVKGEADPEIQATWMLLFDEYNTSTGSKLSMAEKVCYMKVYLWYLKTLKDKKDGRD